jgi:hypothetical protein
MKKIILFSLLVLSGCGGGGDEDGGNYTEYTPSPKEICLDEKVAAADSCYENECASWCVGLGCLYCYASCSQRTSYIYASCCQREGCDNTYNISGSVRTEDGSGVPGVLMEIPGEGTQLTDSNGYYLFDNVSSGTLTPTKSGFCFGPESRSYSPDYSYSYPQYTDQDFLASQTCSSISGSITSSDSNPLAGISVELSGGGTATTLTDGNGNYVFSDLINGTYTVTPSPYGSTPLSRTLTVDLSDVTGQDFVMTGRAISGRVAIDNGTGVPGVTISLSGTGTASTITDASGAYSFSGLNMSSSYTITPSTSCNAYTFNPPSLTVDLIDTDLTGQDFTGSASFSITGSVSANGSPLSGIELTRNGTGVTTSTTDVNGMYSFTQVEGSVNYTIKPSSSDYLFSPIERNIMACEQLVDEQNFSGTKTWARTYKRFIAAALDITPDGNYILAGYGKITESIYDAWLFKINGLGKVLWQKRYDVANVGEEMKSVQATPDGGYIMAGIITEPVSGYDFWVLKLDSSGNVFWQKSYVGAGTEWRPFIRETSDGGYIMSGQSNSFSESTEAIAIRLDSNGNILWQKSYGSGSAYAIHQTNDGGYILAGTTSLFGAGYSDYWLLKLNSAGDILWQKTYGDTGIEGQPSVQQTADGGYILAGETKSLGSSNGDFWVLKLDSAGDILWQKTYGGTVSESRPSILQTIDGGYILAGDTMSFGAGRNDLWLLELDSNGNVLQEKTYGTAGFDFAVAVKQTSDGGYVILEHTGSSPEATIIKTDSTGNLDFCGLTGSSTVTVTNSSVSAVNSSATVADTLLTITDTTVVPKEGTATDIQVCPSL